MTQLLSDDHLELLTCPSHMLTFRLRSTKQKLKVMWCRVKSLQDQWWSCQAQIQRSNSNSLVSATQLFGVFQQQLFLGRFPGSNDCGDDPLVPSFGV